MPRYKNIGKIGIGIVAFEGCEHLYNIITQLRKPKTSKSAERDEEYDLVDAVVVCLQKVGYDDNRPLSNLDLNECIRLRDEDCLVDEIMFPELDTNKVAREQETDKRNQIIDKLKNDYGCDYVIIIDSDEYYSHASFKKACEYIDERKLPITYCEYCNYFGVGNPKYAEYSYRLQLKYPFTEGMFVPFLIKSDYKFKFESAFFNKPSDPTRRIYPLKEMKYSKNYEGKLVENPVFYEDGFHIIPWNVCKMHHLSWIRADIRKKLESWSSKKLFDNYEDLIDKAVQHYETFSPYDVNPKAIMLFNTPGNMVDVAVLPKQYIKPWVDYRTRLRPAKDYKKLLVLSMSADTELFNTLEEVSNKTWRNVDKEKYSNVNAEYWTYTDAKEGEESHVDREKHIIYIKRDEHYVKDEERLNATFSKTVEALEIIKNLGIEYDFLIRTNNSTWLNIPLINEILAYNHDDSYIYGGQICAAFWSAFNMYCRGNLLMMSRRGINILLAIANGVKSSKEFERMMPNCDDNLIGAKLNARFIKLGIPTSKVYHSVGVEQRNSDDISTVEDIDFVAPAYQIKTAVVGAKHYNDEIRIKADVEKMMKVNEMWNSQDVNLDELYQQWLSTYYDKNIWVIKASKKEWFDDSQKYEDSNMSREEALKYLPVRQKECGYSAGLY